MPFGEQRLCDSCHVLRRWRCWWMQIKLWLQNAVERLAARFVVPFRSSTGQYSPVAENRQGVIES